MITKKNDYFVTANSSAGLINLIETNINNLDKIYVLTGSSRLCKQKVLSNMVFFLTDKINSMEIIHSSYDPESIDGLIFRTEKLAVLSDVIYQKNDNQFPEIMIKSINTDAILSNQILPILPLIAESEDQSKDFYKSAYSFFSNAISIHDEWEKIYISNMDFTQADKFTDYIILKLFDNQTSTGTSHIYHRFFGGATWKGSVDFVMDTTRDIGKRYFLKGRPGSGKSTLLKRLQQYATNNGYDVYVYHCGFDPKSLDMILVPELNFCIFDSTAPHEYFPEKNTDEVIDMYSALITPGTDEKYADELSDIKTRYKTQVLLGTSELLNARKNDEQIDDFFIDYILEKNLFTMVINLIMDIL